MRPIGPNSTPPISLAVDQRSPCPIKVAIGICRNKSGVILVVGLSLIGSARAIASCDIPYEDVTATNAVAAGYPDADRSLNLGNVTVLVSVTVDADGSVTNAVVAKSFRQRRDRQCGLASGSPVQLFRTSR